MLKSAIILAIVGLSLAEQGYSAYDQNAYARDSPSSGYGAPTGGYDAPAQTYDYAPAVEDSGLDLGKLGELLPLFLAVFAAIILAQILGPLLLQLLALLVGVLPLALSIKAPLVNAILAPFNLVLAEFPAGGTAAAGPLTVFPAGGRSFADGLSGFGLNLSEDQLNILSDFATKSISALTEELEA